MPDESDIEPFEFPVPSDKKNSNTHTVHRKNTPLPEGEEHTLATLSLDVVSALRGEQYKLLPNGFRYQGERYPLPTQLEELGRVAAVKLNRGRVKATNNSGWDAYVRRCRKEYERRIGKDKVKGEGRVVSTVYHRAEAAREEIEKVKGELARQMDEFRLKAAEATASLADLNALAKKGLRMVMENFTEGKGGVSVAEFTSAAGKVLQQIAKLGGEFDPEGKIDSEEEVFKEFAATRERLARSSGIPITRGPEQDQ